MAELLTIKIDSEKTVSGLLEAPSAVRACYVLAHGAGAGMSHPFLEAVANGLASRSIATLRYQFPYMEQGLKRPDPPGTAHVTVRAAVAEAVRQMPGLPIFAGGKSFGGRMTSQAQAIKPLLQVSGLAFLGFPLHPAGKPSDARAKHLFDVHLPVLFLQGTRDALADTKILRALVRDLGSRATLRLFEHADHSFHVPARSGRKDSEVLSEVVDQMAEWMSV